MKLGYALPQENDEKRKARAERFGLSSAGDENEKLRKRQERFGNAVNLSNSGRIIVDNSGPNRRVREI